MIPISPLSQLLLPLKEHKPFHSHTSSLGLYILCTVSPVWRKTMVEWGDAYQELSMAGKLVGSAMVSFSEDWLPIIEKEMKGSMHPLLDGPCMVMAFEGSKIK